jgi:hypothetical protein
LGRVVGWHAALLGCGKLFVHVGERTSSTTAGGGKFNVANRSAAGSGHCAGNILHGCVFHCKQCDGPVARRREVADLKGVLPAACPSR